jgi:hypothetical protein
VLQGPNFSFKDPSTFGFIHGLQRNHYKSRTAPPLLLAHCSSFLCSVPASRRCGLPKYLDQTCGWRLHFLCQHSFQQSLQHCWLSSWRLRLLQTKPHLWPTVWLSCCFRVHYLGSRSDTVWPLSGQLPYKPWDWQHQHNLWLYSLGTWEHSPCVLVD